MANPAIRVENLSKSYRLGARAPSLRTLREDIMDVAQAPLRWLRGGTAPEQDDRTLWALKDVDWEVDAGDVVGIIGRNGAGKSTTLKILSRVTEPTTGRAVLRGRVGSLLEVGTGFHTELTGRENVFLNGAILGMKRAEIIRRFDEIVAFAEVARFIDTPVKHYSTGMYLRLAFAVAAYLEPEILLVDEVLAVGDVGFQKKCLGKMHDVAKEGRTVLLVSHNMTSITRLCRTTIWMDGGRMRMMGSTESVVARYLTEQLELNGQYVFDSADIHPELQLRAVRLRNSDGHLTAQVDARKGFRIEVDYEVFTELREAFVGLSISTVGGVTVFSACDTDQCEFASGTRNPGAYTSMCTIPGYLLHIGGYSVSVQAVKVVGSSFEMMVDRNVLAFELINAGVGTHFPEARCGVISPRLEWQIIHHPVATCETEWCGVAMR